ncbi:hypothetical protein, partial [Corallococcus sp. AB049A]|uniref:hypothetical protein n=1 Tax=Corallococcus sp. AB049A TaxID=2316721 RepID=UPI001F3FB6DB
ALKSIKQIELHNHRDRKGLRNEDNQDTLCHALQDLISRDIIRTIPPIESDEPNLPITVPDCPLCDLYAKDRAHARDPQDDQRFSHRPRRFNQTRSHSFYNNKKNESAIIPRENTLRKYLIFVNSRSHKYTRLTKHYIHEKPPQRRHRRIRHKHHKFKPKPKLPTNQRMLLTTNNPQPTALAHVTQIPPGTTIQSTNSTLN